MRTLLYKKPPALMYFWLLVYFSRYVEINPDQTVVGSAEEESEDADEDTEPVLIDENLLGTGKVT